MNYSSPKQLFSFIFLVLFLSGQVVLRAEARLHKKKNIEATKLFVFGDSYVDAGNTRKDDQPGAWKEPYGMTYPGKPVGRFSDGRVFSDYVAEYIGLESSPVPYELRKERPEDVKYGMNFASGGTGVFYTSFEPNLTVQIDHFEKMIQENVYNASDVNHSLAYVSVAGNDYVYYLRLHNNSIQNITAFIQLSEEVVNQAKIDLFRIYSLGVKRVAIGGLHPVGCIPAFTSSKQCIRLLNYFAETYHNHYLEQAVMELNQKVKVNTTFLIVDLYDSFDYVIKNPETYHIHDPLRPCCVGISGGNYTCGSVDEKTKEKKYKVCDDTTKAFFWDLAHPTQAGWHAVYSKLKSMKALKKLKY